jgi:hypothetical protein
MTRNASHGGACWHTLVHFWNILIMNRWPCYQGLQQCHACHDAEADSGWVYMRFSGDSSSANIVGIEIQQPTHWHPNLRWSTYARCDSLITSCFTKIPSCASSTQLRLPVIRSGKVAFALTYASDPHCAVEALGRRQHARSHVEILMLQYED